MPKILNITDKFITEKPQLQIGEHILDVDVSLNVILKIEEKMNEGSPEAIIEAIECAIGKEGVNKLDLNNKPLSSFMTILIAILAIAQDIPYDDAAAMFQRRLQKL